MNIRRLLIPAGLFLILLWSCKSQPNEEVLRTYPDGEKLEVALYEGKGSSRQLVAKIGYYRDGTRSTEERYQDGEVVSFRSWWQNGNPRVIRLYEDDAAVSEQSFDSDGVRYLTDTEIKGIIGKLADYVGEPASPEDTVIMVTSAGMIKMRLFTDVAPGHCNNFKRLANGGYYDSTTFHRVAPGFIIQGGDILSRDALRENDGSGGPGYTIPAEFNPRPHRKGSLAMARRPDPNTAGSQFYIALTRLQRLDNQYTVFGEVIDGLDVVDSIAAAPTDSRDNPIYPQRIYQVRVE